MRSPAIAIGIATALWCNVLPPGRPVVALAVSPSPQFRLEFQEFTAEVDPTVQPTPEPARDTLLYGEELERFIRDGVVVRNSFPFDDGIASLGLSVSDTRIEFSGPRPDRPQEQKISVSINAEGRYAYQVAVLQDTLLKNAGSLTISSTGCDRRPVPCSPTYAREWRREGGYGFGYRVTGTDVPADFLQEYTYRPFPVAIRNEPAVPVIGASFARGEHLSEIIFRLNVAPDFQENTYSATITILGLPRL